MNGDVKVLKRNKLLHKKPKAFNAKYLLLYTAVFSALAFIVFYDFFDNEKTLIRSGDAFYQHYKALIYFAQHIREILKNIIFEHRLVIPQWDFEVGMGSDIISTFAYYSFGDPFNYLSFLVPTKYIYIYYQVMVVLRLYCAGLSFSYLCFKTGRKNFCAVLAGAITYSFAAWAVYSGLKHPYFTNPMVFLPLIVLGIENILKSKSFLLFTFMVALSTISNFYFFYIIVLLTVIYVAVRLISVYKTNIKAMIRPLIKITGGSALGVGIGAAIFLPVVIAFLSDSRSSIAHSTDLLYPLATYLNLPSSFITFYMTSPWLFPCLSVLFIPCVAVLFVQRKKNSHIKALLIISIVMICFPVFGRIFNGFSYVCNRWCFGYILVAAYTITASWSYLLKAGKKEAIAVSVSSVLIAASLILRPNVADEAALPLILIAAIAVITILICSKRVKINIIVTQFVLIAFAFVSIVNYSYYRISPDQNDYVAEFSKQSFYEEQKYNCNTAILEASKNDDDEFWRFTGRKITQNASFLANLKSTQYYYSLSNGNISEFRNEMDLSEYFPYCYLGFDSRTVLNTLSSVKYFVNLDKSNKSVPYGYEKTKTKNVWENSYALPFGYTYDEYITKDEFDSLETSSDKEWAMLETVVLENEAPGLKHSQAESTSIEIEYQSECLGNGVTRDGNKFIVTKKESKVELTFAPVENSETLLSLINMEYKGTNPYDLYSDNTEVDPLGLYSFDKLDEEKKDRIISNKNTWSEASKFYTTVIGYSADGESYSNRFYSYTPADSFYTGKSDFNINLGYNEAGMEKVTIVFENIGTYTFDDIKIIAQPVDNYEENVSELLQDTLQNLVIDYNIITGDISLSESKLLCMSMPYANGWTAYVDGKEAELLKVNGMFCGLMLDPGEHEIELRYQTPGLKYGAVISSVSVVIFMFFLVKSFKTTISGKKRKNGV